MSAARRRTTLIALHGFTLNGAEMRRQLGELHGVLEQHVSVVCPDAPNICPSESVERLYLKWQVPRLPPPHLCWWNASDDGAEYRGWNTTRKVLGELAAQRTPVALLGFSQGASVAASLAALSVRGEFPRVEFVICVAGGVPRATELRPLFDVPVELPSLHVWGDRDSISSKSAPLLAERFDVTGREVAPWRGSHTLPSRGAAAEAISDFVERRSKRST